MTLDNTPDPRDYLTEDGHELPPTRLTAAQHARVTAALAAADELLRPCERCRRRMTYHEPWCHLCDCDDYQGMTDWNGED